MDFFFALLPCIRKPGTQTMTEVEGYHITKPSASQMKFCMFACCSATEQQRQCVPVQGSWNMFTFLCKEKKQFAKCRPPFAWWKIAATAIIMF